MNRLDKIALVTAVIATLLGALGSRSFAYDYYADQMLPGTFVIAIVGWAVATYGPLIVAVTFWRCAEHLRPPLPLLLHLSFLPCALAVFWAGDATMLALISDPDFDATLGAPELPALLSLAVAIVGYLFAVIGQRARSTVANGS